jgi:hypothetical protein
LANRQCSAKFLGTFALNDRIAAHGKSFMLIMAGEDDYAAGEGLTLLSTSATAAPDPIVTTLII